MTHHICNARIFQKRKTAVITILALDCRRIDDEPDFTTRIGYLLEKLVTKKQLISCNIFEKALHEKGQLNIEGY